MNRKPRLSAEDRENYEWFTRRWSALAPVVYSPDCKAAWNMLYAFADAVFSSKGFAIDPFVAWRQEAVHHTLFICRRIASINPDTNIYGFTNAVAAEIMRRQPDAWNDATMQGYFESFGVLASHLPAHHQAGYLRVIEDKWNASEDARVLAGGILGEKTFEREVRMTYAEFIARHLTARHYQMRDPITESMRLEMMIWAEADMIPKPHPGLADIARQGAWSRMGEWFVRNPNGTPDAFLYFLENEERARLSRPTPAKHALEAVDMVTKIAHRYTRGS